MCGINYVGNPLTGMTLFGSGTTNNVVPGYDVAFPPVDLCAWRGTGRGVIRDFGMQNQYVQLPAGYPQMAYYLAKNPQLMQYNPMLFGILGGNGCNCNFYA